MKKENIQNIFIYLVIILLILGIGCVGYYFYKDHQKWQGYRNDENKKVFMEEIDKTLKKPKNDLSAEDYLGLGNNYESLGEYDKAIDAYKKSIAKGPMSVTEINLGNAYVEKGDYLKAQDQYLNIIEKSLGQIDVYLKLSELYSKDWQGKKYNALDILLKGEEKNSDDYTILVAIGDIYRDGNDKAKALEYFKKAYKVNKNEALREDMKKLEPSFKD